MTRPVRSVLRGRGRVVLAGAAAALLTATLQPTAPAVSAEESPGCPEAYPVEDLVRGAPVHGLTVSEGTTPDAFTGEVVGVIPDGIALGLDLVMVKLSGSVITDETGEADRGIWAGMSGSPVYAADGRLIGAVSYGLSMSPSEYAGVTPATAMYDLARYDGLTLHGTETVQTTPRSVSQLQAAGLPAPRARSGFARLPMPTSVSGLSADRFGKAARRLGLDRRAMVTGGSAGAGEAAGEIVPGGNIAMAQSYGDLTSAGVGTVTAVCGDAVLAFGHPFSLTGRATASLHGADALYVQRDSTFGSFKVANPTAPVGVFTQDRMAGILGRLGPVPPTVPVTSTVTTSEGNQRSGSTSIVDHRLSADLATMHLLANLDASFNGWRGGTGRLEWTIEVRRTDGTVARLRRSDVYSNSWDVVGDMPWDFYVQLATLLDNRMEPVDLVSVAQEAHLSTTFRQHRLGAVQVRQHHRWVTPGRRTLVRARAGGVLHVRAWLVPAPGSDVDKKLVHFRIGMPRSARGIARVLVSGGESRYDSPAGGADSLSALIRRLATAPTNSTLTVDLQVRARKGMRHVQQRVERSAPIVGTRVLNVAVR
jgi:hypothetical protein